MKDLLNRTLGNTTSDKNMIVEESEMGSDMADEVKNPDQHDHQVQPDPNLSDLPRTVWNIPRFLVLSLIRGYQMTFSRTLPAGSCRFYPSCSHYGYQAIYKYGVLKGGFMAAWRIIRCNPFNKGGFDPVS